MSPGRFSGIGLFLSATAVVVACGSGDNSDTKQSACNGTVSEVQDLVAEVVNDLPGFAGCAPDPENPGGYVVYVTSVDVDLEAARAAIISHDEASVDVFDSAELRKVGLDVSLASDWYREVPPRLITEVPEEHKPDWNWFSSDLDELNYQIILMYTDEDARAWAQGWILDNVDAPPGAIVAVLGDPGQED